jgi:hypothetical protein
MAFASLLATDGTAIHLFAPPAAAGYAISASLIWTVLVI